MAEDGRGLRDEPSTYEKWMEAQGIPIIRDFNIPSLNRVQLKRWESVGGNGAFVVLEGAEDANGAYVLEIPPGGETKPEHHMYEEIVYVLSGRGAATIWNLDGPKAIFEWQEGSLFALPLNASHQFYSGQSDQPARFYVVSSAPLVMNLYHNLDFVFHDNFVFNDRFDGRKDFFGVEGREKPGHIWESNFIADVRRFPLKERKTRGQEGEAVRVFLLSDGTMRAHSSQLPAGTYKKAHRHGPGANVIIVSGKGYSLLWQEGKEDRRMKVDWEEGSVLVPPNMWFHQHFNTESVPARYLAIQYANPQYPLFKAWSTRGRHDVSLKEGGNQIEYEDEDPRILQLFKEELAKKRVPCRMPEIRYNR